MPYELYEGLHGPKRTEAAALVSQLSQKDIKGDSIWSIEEKPGSRKRKE